MIIKYSTKNLIYLSLFSSTFFVLNFLGSNYFKELSIPLIEYLQKDKYIVNSMNYVSYLGSDNFRLFQISLIIVIGSKFQLFLVLMMNSFLSLLINFLKINFKENRPYWINENIKGYNYNIDFAFPSDYIVISFPFFFMVFKIIFYRLELNFLVNSNIFYYIGNSICFFCGLSIGFSRLILGVIYLDQFIEGVILGLLFWFIFKSFLDLDELKLFLEVYFVYNKKKTSHFNILIFFTLFFISFEFHFIGEIQQFATGE